MKAVHVLVEGGADINVKNFINDWTPLHFAAWEGHADVVRLLLDNNADPGVAVGVGYTPLRIAEERGHTTVARILREAEPERSGRAQKIQGGGKDRWPLRE